MAGKTLTDARIRALTPRKIAYDIRDGKLRGFGVRVTSSGRKRFFVHCQHRGVRVWKPRTLYVNRVYLKNQILPRFAGRDIAAIDSRDVRNWFASLAATPVAADRSMPILSVIMREAERMGLRPEGSNPCRGIGRYRRKGRERFLSDDEIRSLWAVLSGRARRQPSQVAAVRLLLLTGCRKGASLPRSRASGPC